MEDTVAVDAPNQFENGESPERSEGDDRRESEGNGILVDRSDHADKARFSRDDDQINREQNIPPSIYFGGCAFGSAFCMLFY